MVDVAQLNQIEGGGSSKAAPRPPVGPKVRPSLARILEEKNKPAPTTKPLQARPAQQVKEPAQRNAGRAQTNWGRGAPGGGSDEGPAMARLEAERVMRSWDDAKSDEQRRIDEVKEERTMPARAEYTNSKGQVRRPKGGVALGVLMQRGDGPDLGTQLKELSWDEYNKLDVNARSRVDVNTLLTQAVNKDQELLGGLDRNRDGKLSVAEAGTEAEGYVSNYNSVFGAAPTDSAKLEFAPHTVAALSLLGAKGRDGDLAEYLAGNRFVTETKAKDRLDKPTGPGQRPSESALRESELSESMSRVAVALDQGRGLAGGTARPVNFGTASNEQFGAFVSSLRADMKAGKQLSSLLSSPGQTDLSVDALAKDDDLQAIITANPAFDNMYGKLDAAAEITDEDFLDEEFMRSILEPQGYTDYDAWERFVLAKRGLNK